MNRLLFCVRSSFDFGFQVLPFGAHIGCKSPKATHVIAARHFQNKVDVCQGPFGTAWVALFQNRANTKLFDGAFLDTGRMTSFPERTTENSPNVNPNCFFSILVPRSL